MKISRIIQEALTHAVDSAGSQELFATKVKVNRSCLSKYLTGKIQNIEHGNWEKLKSIVNSYEQRKRIESEELNRQYRIHKCQANKIGGNIRIESQTTSGGGSDRDYCFIDFEQAESGLYMQLTFPSSKIKTDEAIYKDISGTLYEMSSLLFKKLEEINKLAAKKKAADARHAKKADLTKS